VSASDSDENAKESRPDLIYVRAVPRKGLVFRFVEVKYRRHLRAARNPEALHGIRQQVESLRNRWDEWYSNEGVCSSFRAIRRAKLARVLRFYADKAHRHYLSQEQYEAISSEIDRVIEKGAGYSFAQMPRSDRGWVFCPEYAGASPLEISPAGWDTRVFLFGPGLLPDSEFRRESIVSRRDARTQTPSVPSTPQGSEAEEADGGPGFAERSTVTSNGEPRAEFVPSVEDGQGTSEDVPSVCFGTDVLTGAEVHWPLTVQGNPHLLVGRTARNGQDNLPLERV